MPNTFDRMKRGRVAEYAWRSRTEDELARLRILSLGDDSRYLRLRFDGGEFGPGSWFLDVMVWSSEPAPWQALSVGNLETCAISRLAGFLLDVSQGWRDGGMSCSVEPGGFGLSARHVSDEVVELQVGLGRRDSVEVLDGEPREVPVLVRKDHLVAAAVWLYDEAARFVPEDEVALEAPWMPAEPTRRTPDELIRNRELFLEMEAKRLGRLHEWVADRNRELGFPE
jgi:hypothetical protein